MIMRPFLKIVVGVEFDPKFDFKGLDQFVVIANHNSHVDTMIILCSLPWRLQGKLKPVAAQDYFGGTPFKSFLSQLLVGTLLVKRKPGEVAGGNPIAAMVESLDRGESLLIYPEGSRGEPGVLGPFKSGVARVLKERPEVPYLSAYLWDTWRSLPKGDGLLVPHLCRIRFGVPKKIGPHEEAQNIVQKMRDEIIKLSE
jgi:1-acyl-sn-glycerol-3-phosphate acyltransferase